MPAGCGCHAVAVLELTQDYPVAQAVLWAEVTGSDRLARWFGRTTGRGGTGGSVELVVTAEVDAGGVEDDAVTVHVLECTPPERLRVAFAGGAGWELSLDLVPLGEAATRLTLRQPLPGDTDGASSAAAVEDADGLVAGWRWYLDRLAASLAGTAMPDWSDYS